MLLKKFTKKQDGATILEYIVLGAVLVLGLIVAVGQFRDSAASALAEEGKTIEQVGKKGANAENAGNYGQ